MDVQDFLPRIQAAGFALETDGADIIVRPFSRLSEPQKAFIRQHKPALIAALTGKAQALAPTTGTAPVLPAEPPSHPSIGAELPTTGPALSDLDTDLAFKFESQVPNDLAPVADWLARLGESPDGTAATLARCKSDPEALAYFANLATKPAQADSEPIRLPITPAPSRPTVVATGGQHVRCRDCVCAEATQHPALIVCAAGCRAPGACGMWWNLDRHACTGFKTAGLDLGTGREGRA